MERPRALKTVAAGGHGGQPMQTNRLRNEATINVGAVATTTSPTTGTKGNCIVRSCRRISLGTLRSLLNKQAQLGKQGKSILKNS